MKNILIALGFPLWFPLLLAFGAVALALFVAIFAVVISLWAVFGTLVGLDIGGVIYGFLLLFLAHIPIGCAVLGAALICFGISIFLAFGCKMLTNICILPYKWLFSRARRQF